MYCGHPSKPLRENYQPTADNGIHFAIVDWPISSSQLRSFRGCGGSRVWFLRIWLADRSRWAPIRPSNSEPTAFAIAHLEVCSSWIELRPQFQAFRVSVPYGIRLQSGRGVLEGHESRLVAPPQSAGSEWHLYCSKPLNMDNLW